MTPPQEAPVPEPHADAPPRDPIRELLSFHGRIRQALKAFDDLASDATKGEVDPMKALRYE